MVSKQVKGSFGVHFVAAELYRCGIIATPTTRNTEAIDILASNITGSKAVTIQVKTSSHTEKGRASFPIISYKQNPKEEKRMSVKERTEWIKNKISPNPLKFYIFVYVPDAFFEKDKWEKTPDYYVVPSQKVVNAVLERRKNYLRINENFQITKKSKRKKGRFLKDEGVWYWAPPQEHIRKVGLIKKALF